LVKRVLKGRDEQLRLVFGGLNESEQARLAGLLGQLSGHLAGLTPMSK
jgi:hypothetical protein